MFKSPEQAEYYFHNVEFFNRYCGEFVVTAYVYANTLSNIFKGFVS